MIETTTIARPYAKAAFEAATSTNSVDRWSDFLQALAEVAKQPDVTGLFDNPEMTEDRLFDFFDSILSSLLKDQYAEDERQFTRLLAENRRFNVVTEIQEQFKASVDAHNGVAQANITSAFPIDDKTLASLTKALEAHYGCRIEPHVSVDPSLIGGVRIAVGDEVIDASVREKLNDLAAALTQ